MDPISQILESSLIQSFIDTTTQASEFNVRVNYHSGDHSIHNFLNAEQAYAYYQDWASALANYPESCPAVRSVEIQPRYSDQSAA
ncbi:MAG: hypothetical protein HQ492_00075 [Woeseiaceae bacterium]|nr:hypothetical protein [Woeseiaceae bacterium]